MSQPRAMAGSDDDEGVTRRQFFERAGALGATTGAAGLVKFGYDSARDPSVHTGLEDRQGLEPAVDREALAVDQPTYGRVGPGRRPDPRIEQIFVRRYLVGQNWNDESGLEGLEEPLQSFYREHPEVLERDLRFGRELVPMHRQQSEAYEHQFFLTRAWANAMSSGPRQPKITEPPEISDYAQPRKPAVSLVDPEKTTALLKKISYEIGSALTGIAVLNHDWVYEYPEPGRGFELGKRLEVPAHWRYAIVVGTPMSWDPMFANPNYGTSFDAYARIRDITLRLTTFIRELGYAARAHATGYGYDLMVPPIAVDAGVGEQGRHTLLITPELGTNFRPAVITTDLPLVVDQPLDFGAQDFCASCNICAENCPSGAIPKGEKSDVRGYRRYALDSERCHDFWFSNLGNMGCRLCVAVCPYTKKSNWLHRSALSLTANDPTGLVDPVLVKLHNTLYPRPDPQDYYMPAMAGENESYRDPPWWLKTESFIKK